MTITLRNVKGSALTWNELDANFTDLDGRVSTMETAPVILVTQANAATTLGGTIDSTKEYMITGIIDMTGIQVTVPATGLFLAGWNFDISGLTSSEAAAKMFVSDVGGSGDILMRDMFIEMSGAGSQVYDLIDADGTHSIEVERMNYNNCTSLGVIEGYRQGLETGTGRFGGTPQLTLDGAWSGGFFIDTSIVRALSAGSYSLFSAGGTLSMASRFRTNMNIDLPASASVFDFSAANFPNPNTVQMTSTIVTRNGVADSTDMLLSPNMEASELPAKWSNNVGFGNTFVGGQSCISSATTTVINVVNTPEPIQGTYTTSDLQHFDAPANGQLRHQGDDPIDYKVQADFIVDGGPGDVLTLIVQKSIDGGSNWTDEIEQTRTVLNFVGGADRASFGLRGKLTLSKDDRIRMAIKNTSDTSNVEAEVDSCFDIEARG